MFSYNCIRNAFLSGHEAEEAYDSLTPLPLIPGCLRRIRSLPLVPSAPEQRLEPDNIDMLRCSTKNGGRKIGRFMFMCIMLRYTDGYKRGSFDLVTARLLNVVSQSSLILNHDQMVFVPFWEVKGRLGGLGSSG